MRIYTTDVNDLKCIMCVEQWVNDSFRPMPLRIILLIKSLYAVLPCPLSLDTPCLIDLIPLLSPFPWCWILIELNETESGITGYLWGAWEDCHHPCLDVGSHSNSLPMSNVNRLSILEAVVDQPTQKTSHYPYRELLWRCYVSNCHWKGTNVVDVVKKDTLPIAKYIMEFALFRAFAGFDLARARHWRKE